jgi:hypothetical protein
MLIYISTLHSTPPPPRVALVYPSIVDSALGKEPDLEQRGGGGGVRSCYGYLNTEKFNP